jgi:hypothetical protein
VASWLKEKVLPTSWGLKDACLKVRAAVLASHIDGLFSTVGHNDEL